MTRFFISFGLPSPIPMSDKSTFTEKVRSSLAFLKGKFPGFLRPHLNKSNFVIILVIAFFLIQYLQISNMTGGFSSLTIRGSSLVDEVGKLNQVVSTLGQDLNEVRGFLAMPTRRYSESDSGSGEILDAEDSNQDELQLALFKYVNFVGEQEKLAQKLYSGVSDLNTLFTNKDLGAYLVVNKITLSPLSESAKDWHLSILNEANETVVYLFLDKTTGDVNIQNVSGRMLAEVLESETFATHIKSYLEQNLATITNSLKQFGEKKTYISTSFENESVKQILSLKKLTVGAIPVDKDFKLYYQIKNESKEVVAEIILDKKDFSIQLKDARDSDTLAVKVTDLVSAIPPFLEKLDTIPEMQKRVIEAKAKLGETLDDKGFKLLLNNLNLSISKEMREDEYRYYYDIYTALTGKTKLLGSLVIEKATGMVNVVDPNGTNTTNILFFDPGLKKKL